MAQISQLKQSSQRGRDAMSSQMSATHDVMQGARKAIAEANRFFSAKAEGPDTSPPFLSLPANNSAKVINV